MSEKFHSKYVYGFADRIYGFVQNVEDLSDDVRFDFFADVEKASKPHKKTLLHDLIYNVITSDLDWLTGHYVVEEVETFKDILFQAELDLPDWLNTNEVREYISELDELLLSAVERIVPSIFFIMYSDRAFLTEFQGLIAKHVATLMAEAHPSIVRRDGVLRRPTYIPTWLKQAVYYRDKGRCQLCWTDLTGLLIPIHDRQLDHIVPLSVSGSNDPTNFQLLCADCNQRKGAHEFTTAPRFTPYW